jgi:ubiquinone/menaquinone biosynthesis C-methylase UbiE
MNMNTSAPTGSYVPIVPVLVLVVSLTLLSSSEAFNLNPVVRLPTSLYAADVSQGGSTPRTGLLHAILNLALKSPLWEHVLVPQARQKMMDTASSNGIPWMECKEWIQKSFDDWSTDVEFDTSHIPTYYQQPFHAYPNGNLCWDAAWEAEIASASVGARNFPAFGSKGEEAFRDSFQVCLTQLGASVPNGDGALLVDLGCGTGMSTRRLAQQYPHASKILGLDLSPYFCEVGRRLLALQPKSIDNGGAWVNSITPDERISYQVAAAEATGLPDASVDIVNLQFVAHELPAAVTLAIIHEAHRILKPNGQFWFCEMDFETPAYAAQRANPLLFSLIRATEPYLDDYADHSQDYRDLLLRLFTTTKIGAATGRHFAIVATKGETAAGEHTLEDLRFDENGVYTVEDTHLKVWENKV